MMVDDFDKWRANYDKMSYADQVEFYNQVAIDHPLQQAFDTDAFYSFFDHIATQKGIVSVIEIGGWKGELAHQLIEYGPVAILAWVNYEISQRAAEASICHNGPYQAIVPQDFVWNIDLKPADVLISSHTIEHIRQAQLENLFARLPRTIEYIGLQAPLANEPTDWTGYYGSHILECGWSKIIKILKKNDFNLFMVDNEFRGFERQHNYAGLESRRFDYAIPDPKPTTIPA